jgi:hypothetical protein
LNTGERGVVCRCDPSSQSRPDVCIVVDEKGAPVPTPYEVSLTEKGLGGSSFRRSISGAIDPGEYDIDPNRVMGSWVRQHYAARAAAS